MRIDFKFVAPFVVPTLAASITHTALGWWASPEAVEGLTLACFALTFIVVGVFCVIGITDKNDTLVITLNFDKAYEKYHGNSGGPDNGRVD